MFGTAEVDCGVVQSEQFIVRPMRSVPCVIIRVRRSITPKGRFPFTSLFLFIATTKHLRKDVDSKYEKY